jgi:hypothetical protein
MCPIIGSQSGVDNLQNLAEHDDPLRRAEPVKLRLHYPSFLLLDLWLVLPIYITPER